MVTTQLKILFLNQETPPITFCGDLPPHSPTPQSKSRSNWDGGWHVIMTQAKDQRPKPFSQDKARPAPLNLAQKWLFSCPWSNACDRNMDDRSACCIVYYQRALGISRGFEAFNLRPWGRGQGFISRGLGPFSITVWIQEGGMFLLMFFHIKRLSPSHLWTS